MIIILLVTHKYIIEERWRCTLEGVWLHSGYRYRSVADHTAAIAMTTLETPY
jgi:hypothetical protein